MYTLKNIATILPQALYEDQGRSGHFTLSSCDVIFFTVMEYRLHYQSLFFIKNIPFTTTHRATLWSTQSSIPWLLGGGVFGLQHPEDEVHIYKPNTTVDNAIKNFITLCEDPTDEQVIKLAG